MSAPTADPLWPAWPMVARRLAAAEQLFLGLDCDGTLAPLADHPAAARVPAATRRTLRRLAARPDVQVAVISGRALRDLRRLVRVPRICYVGNHGLEMDGRPSRPPPALAVIRRRLAAIAREVPGAWVEDKRMTLSVHTRGVRPDDVPRLLRRLRAALRPYQARRQIRVTMGQQVLEVRPPGRWTKGTAVRRLLRRLEGRPMPVIIGDDTTDEDAFAAVGALGVTIAVGPTGRRTKARYAVRTPDEVHLALQRLLALRRRRDALAP
ncbi:MAG: trehalose-phosphatase [Omnitrophica WOR_2 bacterium RIFCSPHIGHO2_02_FULL_68_15]|nr:MAG: trehalose-phosphatase [Omnitrophica WOR_2 bacterium RIFCSPHIGHO2_02_FULL_68_15]